jgi:hypothetical protein
VTTFGVGYGLGVLVAFATAGSTNAMCPCPTGNQGRSDLLIPVVGPWLAMGSTHSGAGALALLGIVQATGVALTVGGIVRYVSDGTPAEGLGDATGTHHARSRSGAFLSFGVLPTRDGAFGFLSGRM